MIYELYGIVEAFGDYEAFDRFIICYNDPNERSEMLKKIHMNWRGSTENDFEQWFQAYNFDGGMVLKPYYNETLDQEKFDFLKNYFSVYHVNCLEDTHWD